MNLLELGYRIGLEIGRGIREGSAGKKCAHPPCHRPPFQPGARYCSTHHQRHYRGASMDAACPDCGGPSDWLNARCSKCRQEALSRKRSEWFQRKKATDPAWWAARKARISAAYHAKKAAKSQQVAA